MSDDGSDSVAARGTTARDISARIAALTAAQRRMLAAALDRELQPASPERLVAFVVCDPAAPPTEADLRAFAGARLPEYMVPTRFVAMERLPRSAAGKLDRRALAAQRGTELQPAAPERPRTSAALDETAATLVAIWRDVLKVDDVDIDDDFFEIGGDSLLSIRVIARAGRAGIRISPERFFENPTIRHMAASAANASIAAHVPAPSPGAPTVAVDAVGEAPLTPIQHWFLDAVPGHRDWWNQGYVLSLDHALDAEALREVTRALVHQHDALRLRLVQRDGRWYQDFPPPGDTVPFRRISLADVDPAEYPQRVEADGEREHGSLHLGDGNLFRVLLFEGADAWRRLLLLGHHIVLDGVSWQVILEDLATLVTQARTGAPLHLPAAPPAASARAWAHGLVERASSPAVAAMANHWLEQPNDGGISPLAATATHGAADDGSPALPHRTTQRDADVITVTLDHDETRTLIHDAPARLDGTVQSLLLAALLSAWHAWTSHPVLRLDLEGHGRDALGHAFDASRTVGWFTTVFPVRLALPAELQGGIAPTGAGLVRVVQRALDALPLRGAAHGLLRYLSPDHAVRDQLGAAPRPDVLFNYLGAHDLALPAASGMQLTAMSGGRARHPDVVRPYLLELNAHVREGQLIVAIEYARQVHSAPTMHRFATLLRDALLRTCGARPDAAALSGLDAEGLQTVADLLRDMDADAAGDEDLPP